MSNIDDVDDDNGGDNGADDDVDRRCLLCVRVHGPQSFFYFLPHRKACSARSKLITRDEGYR